jgi:hypothetical protein
VSIPARPQTDTRMTNPRSKVFLTLQAEPNSTKAWIQLKREVLEAAGPQFVDLGAAEGNGLTPREAQHAAQDARKAEMLAEVGRLTAGGKGRIACTLVAQVCAADPLDPVEVASLTRQLRRWRGNNSGQCPE